MTNNNDIEMKDRATTNESLISSSPELGGNNELAITDKCPCPLCGGDGGGGWAQRNAEGDMILYPPGGALPFKLDQTILEEKIEEAVAKLRDKADSVPSD